MGLKRVKYERCGKELYVSDQDKDVRKHYFCSRSECKKLRRFSLWLMNNMLND